MGSMDVDLSRLSTTQATTTKGAVAVLTHSQSPDAAGTPDYGRNWMLCWIRDLNGNRTECRRAGPEGSVRVVAPTVHESVSCNAAGM